MDCVPQDQPDQRHLRDEARWQLDAQADAIRRDSGVVPRFTNHFLRNTQRYRCHFIPRRFQRRMEGGRLFRDRRPDHPQRFSVSLRFS